MNFLVSTKMNGIENIIACLFRRFTYPGSIHLVTHKTYIFYKLLKSSNLVDLTGQYFTCKYARAFL